jgi:hypothetical protein
VGGGGTGHHCLLSHRELLNGPQQRAASLHAALDGFVSLHAPMSGGEVLTKPLTFTSESLSMNFATSAAGSVKVEIQDANGKAIPDFTLSDCEEHFGDSIERAVVWKSGSDVSPLAGNRVRLRFVLKDADVYSFRLE